MTRVCSECGTPLGGVIYGECGPHMFSDFIEATGYKLDVGDLYGDWEMPDYFVLPSDKLPPKVKVWTTKDRCCHYAAAPMADDFDYCPTCKDCMEPASVDSRTENES